MGLTEEQLERYSRNIILAQLGLEGQESIRESRVLIVGAGGLGSPAVLYLAAAGIGLLVAAAWSASFTASGAGAGLALNALVAAACIATLFASAKTLLAGGPNAA